MIIRSFTIRNRRCLFLAIFIGTAGGLFLNPLPANAAVRTSTATGGTWATGSTWVGGVAPTSTDDAIIATTGVNTVNIGANATIVNLTINSSAILTHSSNRTLGVTGNYTNNGTHTTGSGAITLSGSGATINGSGSVGGTGNFAFSTAKTIAATANLTVAQTIAITAAVTITNNGTINAGGNITGSAAGSTWVNAANSTLNISGVLLSTGTLTASANPNTINYNMNANQTVKATATYHHLTLSGSGTKTLTTTTTAINGNLTLSETAAATTVVGLSIGGNLDVGSGTTFTAAGFALTVTGPTSVTGTLTISSSTGTKSFNGDFTVNLNGTFNNTAANAALILPGSLSNSGTFNPGTGLYTLSGASKTISGTFANAFTSMTISGAGVSNSGTFTTGTLTVNNTFSNTGTITTTTALAGSSTFTNSTNGVLNVNFTGAMTLTNLTASVNPNTVDYGFAGAQTVKAPTTSYYHLTLSNSGAKTPVSNLTIDGDLTLSDTAALSNTNNPSFNIAENVQVAAGNTWTKGTGIITLAGTSGTQSINFAGKTVEDIVIDATGATKQFTGSVITDSFTATNGTLDFNGQSITTTGNFTMGTGSQVIADANAMDGAVINVGGDCDLDGQDGDPLIFKWTGSGNDAWTLAVTGNIDMDYVTFTPASTNTMALHVSGPTATASNVIVDYSDADNGFTTIDATDGTNTDGSHNTNWLFTILSVTLRNANDTADYTTWALGSGKDLDTVYIMNNTECVLVKNNGGPAAEDFSISATGTNWTLSNATGLDTCVLMGLFNGNSAPVAGDFSTTYDIINGTTRWATTSGGNGNYEGTNDGDNVAASTGEKLYIYLKTPSSLSQGSEESITVTVGCRKH